ncbi:MAG TPA: YifB family Mg chelatase-like AAA ATPase [Candidatus Limnocylindria bacterium]|nr:YifB family Mg chelatase-like AAA ATPase [Candidatus Limnocylindria bacterium]
MALARTRSVALVGVVGQVVDVEVDLGRGLPAVIIVGLPDAALNEARDRVRAALANSGATFPDSRVTINLSPASLPKHGTGFDLALAVALLAATDVVPANYADRLVCLGELGLDGSVRPVRGVLPSVLAARAAGWREIVVSPANAAEAALVPGIAVLAAAHLRLVIGALRGECEWSETDAAEREDPEDPFPDLGDVAGQPEGRQALEVAAAGAHHLLLQGPPGAGKTLLAERLPSILPPLIEQHALEVTAVHSVAGLLPPGRPLVVRAPFRAPHHTASAAALVGGGAGVARPGAVSLAHRGVLFLDEAPEFGSDALEALRQPLESGRIVLSRAHSTVTYPARFQLVLAANPCPCGRVLDRSGACRCTPMQVRRYAGRLSGPLLDRIDLQLAVQDVPQATLLDGALGESSAIIAQRVLVARDRAAARLEATPWTVNAEVPGPYLRARLPLRGPALRRLRAGGASLTARGIDRIIRVAWTLADLHERSAPDQDDVETALGFRLGQLRGAA